MTEQQIKAIYDEALNALLEKAKGIPQEIYDRIFEHLDDATLSTWVVDILTDGVPRSLDDALYKFCRCGHRMEFS